MRNYDYQKAKEYITANADQIEEALMGMHEDWFWTAETVFSEGEFKKDLDDEPSARSAGGAVCSPS